MLMKLGKGGGKKKLPSWFIQNNRFQDELEEVMFGVRCVTPNITNIVRVSLELNRL